jgi:hypothetical protein
MMVEIDAHKINWIKSKKKYLVRLHLLEILSKNNFFIFKNKFQLYKKNNRWIKIISSKIKHIQNN